MESTRLRCLVTTGLFEDERVVILEAVDGRRMTAIVDKADVSTETQLEPGHEVPGWVRARVVAPLNGAFLVDLP